MTDGQDVAGAATGPTTVVAAVLRAPDGPYVLEEVQLDPPRPDEPTPRPSSPG